MRTITTVLEYGEEKKHSVRYNHAAPATAALQSVYVSKKYLAKPYPPQIKVTIEEPTP